MNEQRPDQGPEMGAAELRMALRGLRQDCEPGHDLWPGIAARIQSVPQRPAPSVPAGLGRWWPLAAVASMVLAVGVAWQLKPSGTLAAPAHDVAIAATLVQREADSMTAQYRAALLEMEPGSVAATWQPGLEALDRSAAEIRAAMQHDPGSRLLLERLRATYTRRLALARRALHA